MIWIINYTGCRWCTKCMQMMHKLIKWPLKNKIWANFSLFIFILLMFVFSFKLQVCYDSCFQIYTVNIQKCCWTKNTLSSQDRYKAPNSKCTGVESHKQMEVSAIKFQLDMVFAFTLVYKPYIYIWLWHQCNGGQPKALRVKINETQNKRNCNKVFSFPSIVHLRWF